VGSLFLFTGTGEIIEIEPVLKKAEVDKEDVYTAFQVLKNMGYVVVIQGSEDGKYVVEYMNKYGYVGVRLNVVDILNRIRVRVGMWSGLVGKPNTTYSGIATRSIGEETGRWEYGRNGNHVSCVLFQSEVPMAISDGKTFLGGMEYE
jgi:hypothetical protein